MTYVWDFLNDKHEIANRQSTLELIRYQYAIVIGLGGIGSWVALDLALSGQIKTLYLYDYDKLEESNLNRTPYKFTQIGLNKAHAISQLILERRPNQIMDIRDRKFIEDDAKAHNCAAYYGSDMVVFDCRDDTFDDLKSIKKEVRIWKLGYDGLELTIDGDPRKTTVWGQSDGYTVTPSFLCPSQLIANLAVCHSLVANYDVVTKDGDNKKSTSVGIPPPQFEGTLTFDCNMLLMKLAYLDKLETHIKKKEANNAS